MGGPCQRRARRPDRRKGTSVMRIARDARGMRAPSEPSEPSRRAPARRLRPSFSPGAEGTKIGRSEHACRQGATNRSTPCESAETRRWGRLHARVRAARMRAGRRGIVRCGWRWAAHLCHAEESPSGPAWGVPIHVHASTSTFRFWVGVYLYLYLPLLGWGLPLPLPFLVFSGRLPPPRRRIARMADASPVPSLCSMLVASL
jgi:hypothetical protein